MGYYFVRYMPKKMEVFPGEMGAYHPALIARCSENPVGVDIIRFVELVKDPFERALVLTTGIIIDYFEPAAVYSEEALKGGYIRKAWRVKKGRYGQYAVQRGHRLKVRE